MLMGASNLMMGLTLVLVICLAIVLGLVLVLLAELYCSIIIRRRHTTTTTTRAADADATVNSNNNTPSPPLTNFYTQSILSAPRNILYPDVGAGADIEKQPPENQVNGNSGRKNEGLMYISNPMFDDENGRRSAAVAAGNTPFETPDSSPSRLETGSSEDGGDDDEVGEEVMSVKVIVETPPLTPMKKLPATVEGGGDLNMNINSSNNENEVSSTSSSGTPCTSLSW